MKKKEIQKIHKRYGALDTDKKGFVSIDDLTKIPEIDQNPLRFHIAQYLSNKQENEAIDFEAFVKLIDIFKNNKTEEQQKCKILFLYKI